MNHAKLPIRGSSGVAGYDLHPAERCIIPVNSRGVVKTGIAIEIPEGLYARIAPRSRLLVKKSIDVGAGVIDRDYRGEIGVVLINHSSKDFEVNVGDRIAQMILEQIKTPEVEEQPNLDQTDRGGKRFGSSRTNEMKNELGQEKSGQKNEFGENEIGTVQEENVKQIVKDTVNDQGVKDAVVKDVGLVKETEGSDAGNTDQQSK